MADRFHSPMPGTAWRQALRSIVVTCAGGSEAEEADCLRDLHAVLTLAPPASALDGFSLIDPVRLERLLGSNAADSAALSMLGGGSGYMVSGGGEGGFLATVALPGQSGERFAPGATLALALTGAMAEALLFASEGAEETRARAASANPGLLH